MQEPAEKKPSHLREAQPPLVQEGICRTAAEREAMRRMMRDCAVRQELTAPLTLEKLFSLAEQALDAAGLSRDYRDFAQHLVEIGGVVPTAGGACCRGPVQPKDSTVLEKDLANLRCAVDAAQPIGVFMKLCEPHPQPG